MGNGETMSSGEEFKPDFSLLGSLKQRIEGSKLVQQRMALLLLLISAGSDELSKDDIRSILPIVKKIKKWEQIDVFLKKQGPLSEDDVMEFNLTDDEVSVLTNMQMKLTAQTQSREEIEQAYQTSNQNPLPLQLTQFYRSSKRIFKVPADRQGEFADDDFGEMTWGDLMTPHRSFAIAFEPPIAGVIGTKTPVVFSGLIVNRLHDIDPSYSENAIQIRAIVSNSPEIQELSSNDTGKKQRDLAKKNIERACMLKIQDRLLGKDNDKNNRKFQHWSMEFNAIQRYEDKLSEHRGQTVEVDLTSRIKDTSDDILSARIFKILAGTCLFVANSKKQRVESHDSPNLGPRDFEVTTLQSRDKTHEIKLTPQEMLENARTLQHQRGELVDPHKRREHDRTLHRGTSDERIIRVKEALVVGRKKVLPRNFTFGVTTSIIKSGA